MKTRMFLTLSTLFLGHLSSIALASTALNNCEDVLAIPKYSSKSYHLSHSIDCADYTLTEPKDFAGILDGRGFSIQNLTIKGHQQQLGLFALLKSATIKNIELNNFKMIITPDASSKEASHMIGILAGVSFNSQLQSVRVVSSKIQWQHAAKEEQQKILVAPIIGLFYLGKASHLYSHKNVIETQKNISSLGGIFAEIYESRSLKDLNVEQFVIKSSLRYQNSGGSDRFYGGIAGRIASASIEELQVSQINFEVEFSNSKYGLLFGLIESSTIKKAQLTQNHIHGKGLYSGVVGLMTCYDVNAYGCFIQDIEIDDLEGQPWYTGHPGVQNKRLTVLN